LVEHLNSTRRERIKTDVLPKRISRCAQLTQTQFRAPGRTCTAQVQHTRARVSLSAAGNTHRYAGGMAQIKLKNRMTRHESRRPSPKDTGPSVPVENLVRTEPSPVVGSPMLRVRGLANARHNVRICGKPYKKYLDKMRFGSVFDSDGMDTCPIQWQAPKMGSAIPRHVALFDQG
jgi:hypothetical protein